MPRDQIYFASRFIHSFLAPLFLSFPYCFISFFNSSALFSHSFLLSLSPLHSASMIEKKCANARWNILNEKHAKLDWPATMKCEHMCVKIFRDHNTSSCVWQVCKSVFIRTISNFYIFSLFSLFSFPLFYSPEYLHLHNTSKYNYLSRPGNNHINSQSFNFLPKVIPSSFLQHSTQGLVHVGSLISSNICHTQYTLKHLETLFWDNCFNCRV